MFRTVPANKAMVEAVKRAVADPGWLGGRGKVVEATAIEYVSQASPVAGHKTQRVLYRTDIIRVTLSEEDVGVSEPGWLEAELKSAAGSAWEYYYDTPGDYNNQWFILSTVQYGYV